MGSLLVFDMDGVIIDVSASYRDAVRKTAYIFLSSSKGAEKLPDPLFSLSDLSAVKQSGGLNNDWDLSHRVITLLLSKVSCQKGSPDRSTWDVSPIAEFLANNETPLKLLSGSVREKSAAADFYYKNDVGSGNVIKQIFQEVYLGAELFRETYGFEPEYCYGEGLILKEKMFIGPDILSALSEKHTLAIATGRPESEALYPIRKNNINFFDKIITLDDCLIAEKKLAEKGLGKRVLSKPDPFMLDSVAAFFSGRGKSFDSLYYIGDMPDDMIAAKKSAFGYKAAGVLFSSPDPEASEKRLLEAGADCIIANARDLLKLSLS